MSDRRCAAIDGPSKKTPESSTVVRLTAALAAALFPAALVGLAQPAPPAALEQSVEAQVLAPPRLVNMDGASHLVHELHVTNMRRDAVTLERVVLVGATDQAPLGEWAGDELQRRIGRPGLAKVAEPRVLTPGHRAVVYLWTRVAAPAPRTIAHRLSLQVGTAGAERQIAVQTASVDVASEVPARIGPPLAGGPWVAIFDPLLIGGHRTALYTLGGRTRVPARFAVDWVKAPAAAGSAGRYNTAPDYNGLGADVLAVGDGAVTQARDGVADLPQGVSRPAAPVPLDAASGNFIVLALADGRHVIYEHLKQGSVAVRAGQKVRRGERIAQLGSSGSTSIGPHLHFHLADADSTLMAEGVPFGIDRFTVLGRYPSLDAFSSGDAWTAGADDGARRDEQPGPMTVVQFAGAGK